MALLLVVLVLGSTWRRLRLRLRLGLWLGLRLAEGCESANGTQIVQESGRAWEVGRVCTHTTFSLGCPLHLHFASIHADAIQLPPCVLSICGSSSMKFYVACLCAAV